MEIFAVLIEIMEVILQKNFPCVLLVFYQSFRIHGRFPAGSTRVNSHFYSFHKNRLSQTILIFLFESNLCFTILSPIQLLQHCSLKIYVVLCIVNIVYCVIVESSEEFMPLQKRFLINLMRKRF